MRKNRFIGQDRCYHLISRLAHRAFFLDDEEKDRAVALMRRVEEFSGVVVLAYAFMSNHFHIFVYVPKAEEIDEAEVMRVRAGETLPLADGDDALLPADEVSISTRDDGTAVVIVPRTSAAARFFRVEGCSP